MKKISVVVLLVIACFLTSCSFFSSGSAPQDVPDAQMQEDLRIQLEEHGYRVETFAEFTVNNVDFSEEDKKSLMEKFTSTVPAVTKQIKFKSTSIMHDVSGTYNLLYAYYNGSWIVVSGYKYDEKNWMFLAKDKVSNMVILDTIISTSFGSFEKGTIGSETNTIIEVTKRNTDLNIGTDTVCLNIIYDSLNAQYKIPVKIKYEFIDGSWKSTSTDIEPEDSWVIDFNESMMPPKPSHDVLTNVLTNSSQYQTYRFNPSYYSDFYITDGEIKKTANSISYCYVLIVKYNRIGTFEYDLTQTYEWEGSSWKSNELSCKIKSADLSLMVGTWSSANGSFLNIKDTDKMGITGYYVHKYADDSFVTYEITGTVVPVDADNLWTIDIKQGGINNGEEIEPVKIMPFKINFKTGELSSNGAIYELDATASSSGWVISEENLQNSSDGPVENIQKNNEEAVEHMENDSN